MLHKARVAVSHKPMETPCESRSVTPLRNSTKMVRKSSKTALSVVSAGLLTATFLGMAAGPALTASPALAASASTAPLVIGGLGGTFQENFNPFSAALKGTMGMIYQPLFYFNRYTSKVTPLLGMSFGWSNHDKTLTVHLRHGVQWSDGKPFTARDVVYSFDIRKRFPQLDTAGVWQYLSDVRAIGPYTVQFQFKQIDVPFQWYILGQTPIIPQHIWANVANPATTLNLRPIGTGPYVFHSFNSQEYSFAANPRYFAGEPAVRQVQFLGFANNTVTAGELAQGRIDWGSAFIPNIQRVFVQANPRTNHYWFAGGATLMLYTNFKDPLLSQLSVREAISYALNRQKINQADYYYAPIANVFDMLNRTTKAWLSPALARQYKGALQYNPAKAVAIIRQAGFKKNSNGVFVSPSGKALSFNLQVVSTYSEWVAMASIIASELDRVGIHVNVQGESASLYGNNLFKQHQYQLAISWTDTGPTPFYAYYSMMYPNLPSNSENWNSPATTRLLNTYLHTAQPAVQHRVMDALEGIVARDMPAIPLVETPGWFEYSTKNFVGWPTAKNPYAGGAPWSSPSNGIVLEHLRPVK